jgi:hypothetical protein
MLRRVAEGFLVGLAAGLVGLLAVWASWVREDTD